MSTPKAQFQVDHGSGWKTIAEVDIIDGVAQAPNEWTMVRALRKQIVYTGWVEETITVPPNPRDTHYLGFARALQQEIDDVIYQDALDTSKSDRDLPFSQQMEELKIKVQTLIARRAYDLVKHTVLNVSIADLDMLSSEECVQRIPDLTELPKEK